MSRKNVEPERVRKGPMTVEEIKAMRAAEGMIVDLEDEGTNVYVIRAYQEKMSVAVGKMYKQARREMGLTQQEVADADGADEADAVGVRLGLHAQAPLGAHAAHLGLVVHVAHREERPREGLLPYAPEEVGLVLVLVRRPQDT